MQTHSQPLHGPTPGPSFCVQYTMEKIFPDLVFYVHSTMNNIFQVLAYKMDNKTIENLEDTKKYRIFASKTTML